MSAGNKFEQLVSIMARLRAPGGCPWDREQTFDSIKPYLLEETYEVMQAIDERDWPELSEELGDLLLQVVFFSQMAADAGHFTIEDPIEAINAKLIRRHPHVFADETAETEGDVRKLWGEIKAKEKANKGAVEAGMLDSIPRVLPALVEAQHIASRAAGAGFDWPNIGEVLAKLDEERREFEAVMETGEHSAIEDELGDLLFVIVNLARFVKVDPEQALRRTNAKFRTRFAHVEKGIAGRGKKFSETTIGEMEELWQEAKRK
jgi:MazG family protein